MGFSPLPARLSSLFSPSVPLPGQVGAAWGEPIGTDFCSPITHNGPHSRESPAPKQGGPDPLGSGGGSGRGLRRNLYLWARPVRPQPGQGTAVTGKTAMRNEQAVGKTLPGAQRNVRREKLPPRGLSTLVRAKLRSSSLAISSSAIFVALRGRAYRCTPRGLSRTARQGLGAGRWLCGCLCAWNCAV